MPALLDHQAEHRMPWKVEEDVAQKRRDELPESCRKSGAKAITTLASIIARGSTYLILEPNGFKVVLVLTDTDQYEKLDDKNRGVVLPTNDATFYAGFAGGVGDPRNKKHYTDADFAFAQLLHKRYPKGCFYFPKSKLAHTELLKAIADARSGPVAQVAPRPQVRKPKPASEQQAAANNKSTNKLQGKKVIRKKARPQGESEEESESEESDETDELESDAEEEGMDSSDVEIVVPKEEEEDSDIEIVEAPKASKKISAPRKKPLKRARPASSDEEEDSDNGTPPAPSPAPKQLHKKDKQSGEEELNREVRNLHSRFNDRTVGQQALDIGDQYSLGVQARAQARKARRSVARDHLQEVEDNAKLAEEHRKMAASYEERTKEARQKLREQLERSEDEGEDEAEEGEAYRAAQKKLMARQKLARFV